MENTTLSHVILLIAMVVTTANALTTSSSLVNVTFGDLPALYTFEDTHRIVNVIVHSYEGEKPAILLFESTNPSIFQVVNQSLTYVSPDDDYPKNFTFVIRGIALGIEDLLVKMQYEDRAEWEVVYSLKVKVNIQPKRILVVVKYVMLVCVIFGFINMGGTIDLALIWQKLRRPWGVLIGILCQFMIMPPLAFGLAKALRLDAPSAIGLVLDGSCPGGYLSNILSVMLDVDYVLSLTMTFCSNILAMGMMPLNLFIYTPPLTEGNVQLETPFTEIGLQLVLLFIPISIGMFFKYKSPRIHRFCQRLLKPLSSILMALFLCTSLPFQLFIFAAPRSTYIAAFLLPLCGSLIGFVISKLACLPLKSMTTIALETGVQNAILATTIITFFYPHPEAEIASRAPYLILLMTTLEGLTLVIVYMIVKRFFWKARDDEQAIVDDKGVDDMDIEKNRSTVTEMIKNGVLKEVNANDVDEKNLKIEIDTGCQTDFNDMSFANPCFVK